MEDDKEPGQFRRNALTSAVLAGDELRVARLLDEGWDVNARSEDGGTWPLMLAAKSRHAAIIRMLITRGARSQRDEKGRCELHVLAEGDEGPYPHEDGSRWGTIIQQWLGTTPHSNSAKLWKLLISAGASPAKADSRGVTPFHIACARGNWPVVKFLLEDQSVQHVINLRNSKGATPLHYACRYGRTDVVKILLSYGADIFGAGKHGTPAETAHAFGHTHVAQMIDDWSVATQPLLHVPSEVMIQVFTYLEPQDLCALAQSCRMLNALSGSDYVWQRFCDPSSIEGEKVAFKAKYMSWLRPRLKQYARYIAHGKTTQRFYSTQSAEVDYIFKFNLMGDAGVGKTCLFKRYLYQFQPAPTTTIGVEFGYRTVHLDGFHLKLQIWDTGGQERYRRIMSAYYRATRGVVFMFDITCSTSFDNVTKWFNDFTRDRPYSELPPILLVGTKHDLAHQRHVSLEEIENKVKEIRAIGYVEVSSLTCHQVDEVFEKLAKAALNEVDPFFGDDVERSGWYVPRKDYLISLCNKTSSSHASVDRIVENKLNSSCLLQ